MVNDFTWHEVSEKEKAKFLKKQNKLWKIFSKKLDKVKISDGERIVNREVFARGEGEVESATIDRDLFFKNAPKASKDFIIAEKGGWIE
jgi:Asp-tRNA(Asn)/Glu-tRNA(Gln) amidotransferase C subunit